MQVEKTAQGRWVLYDTKTGERIERWPVDARGMLDAGTHTITPPDNAKQGAGVRSGTPAGETGGVQFDPVKTPSMDRVGGATHPGAPPEPGEAVLGASTEVTAIAPAEEPGEVQNPPTLTEQGRPPIGDTLTADEKARALPPAPVVQGAGASASSQPVGGALPTTTPLGVPAVHSRATDAGPARTDQAPVRRIGRGGASKSTKR